MSSWKPKLHIIVKGQQYMTYCGKTSPEGAVRRETAALIGFAATNKTDLCKTCAERASND